MHTFNNKEKLEIGMSTDDEIIDQVALEIVSSVRRLHFQDGTSAAAKTKRLKEIIEKNSHKVVSNAS